MGVALLLQVGLVGPLQAQDRQGPTGRLGGRVIDEASGEPLEGATVALWSETATDSTLVTGTVTGPDGRFSFEAVPVEAYILRVSFVGYTDRRFPETRPRSDPEAADLGRIRLSPETQQAGEVEVTADRPAARTETDRTVYNTAERAVSAGVSARTVLETLPSVRIDVDGTSATGATRTWRFT
jgi:hypothetical protein